MLTARKRQERNWKPVISLLSQCSYFCIITEGCSYLLPQPGSWLASHVVTGPQPCNYLLSNYLLNALLSLGEKVVNKRDFIFFFRGVSFYWGKKGDRQSV